MSSPVRQAVASGLVTIRRLVFGSLSRELRGLLPRVLQSLPSGFERPVNDVVVQPIRPIALRAIVASDYASLVFLRPLFARLSVEAPGIRLRVVPFTTDMASLLNRGVLDLAIFPLELAGDLMRQPRKALFEDRFVLAADRDNPLLSHVPSLDEPPDTDAPHPAIDVDLLRRLPFAVFTGPIRSLVDTRLEEHGVELRVDISSEAFVIVPMLLRGTTLVCFTQERLARHVQNAAHLRLYRSPVDVGGLRETMFWSPRSSRDPAQRWLRSTLIAHAQQFSPLAAVGGSSPNPSAREPAPHEHLEGVDP